MKYNSDLEMVWKTGDSLKFKLYFTWITFIKWITRNKNDGWKDEPMIGFFNEEW
jgi:hypothetical protein